MDEGHASDLYIVIAFLLTAVIFVPLFKRAGLGPVLGYLCGGVLLGVLATQGVLGNAFHALTEEPEAIREFAELGVVFLLFLIGLELNVSRLWSMRRDIFGLGALQVVGCGVLLMTFPLFVVGRPVEVALIAGLGLALSSTALVMRIIEERNSLRLPYGQKTFAVLLMQDIAIVPLLVLVTLLSPGEEQMTTGAIAWSVAQALVAVAIIVGVGHYLLSPAFRLLARFGGQEIMTAAALLTVLAAGTIMVSVGLSMAMGAFLAGVLLAESTYRHELEADIEPFRSLLLGLFFLSVGLSLDLGLIADNWRLLAAGVLTLLVFKALAVYGLVRAFGGDHPTGVKSGILLSQGGEFGFVLFTTAAAQGVMTREDADLLSATVILSMVTTPFLVRYVPRLLIRAKPKEVPTDDFTDVEGEVLIVGFGRFGQLVSQMMLAGGFQPVLLDNDANRITEARRFGTRVYYGDGRRLDLLRAARADRATLIAVCTSDPEVTDEIVDLIKAEFPHTRVFARAYDRRHALSLFDRKVDYERRETFDSAIRFGRDALLALGLRPNDAKDSEILVRRRDRERLEYQRLEGMLEGYQRWKAVTPEPYVRVERDAADDDEAQRAEAAE